MMMTCFFFKNQDMFSRSRNKQGSLSSQLRRGMIQVNLGGRGGGGSITTRLELENRIFRRLGPGDEGIGQIDENVCVQVGGQPAAHVGHVGEAVKGMFADISMFLSPVVHIVQGRLTSLCSLSNSVASHITRAEHKCAYYHKRPFILTFPGFQWNVFLFV